MSVPEVAVTTVPVTVTPGCIFGGRELVIIAGPCAVEDLEMLRATARAVADAGATMLRGGAFKPRTSPHTFQGLGSGALPWLADVSRETQLATVTEVGDPRQVEATAPWVDMLQIGARSMQNYPLLAEVGQAGKPVLLKRGLAATLKEFLLAAEHIRVRGNDAVVLCERGIRTFETAARFTLDVSAIPVLKQETHLPVIVDPSHAGGRASLVLPLARAAVAAGADGLMIEVHPEPSQSRSDADQALDFAGFRELMRQVDLCAGVLGRARGLMRAGPVR